MLRSDQNKANMIQKVILPIVGLLVTVLLGILAFQADRASARIQAAQLDLAAANRELAEAQERRQADEAKLAKQLKYIELFYSGLQSGRPMEGVGVLALLQPLDPETAEILLRAVEENPLYPDAVHQEAAKLRRWGSSLSRFDLIIYVDETDGDLLARAKDIKRKLLLREYPGKLNLSPMPPSWLDRVGVPAHLFEIRYEDPYEKPAARKLQQVLRGIYPLESFHLMPVVQASPDKLTLFLFRAGG